MAQYYFEIGLSTPSYHNFEINSTCLTQVIDFVLRSFFFKYYSDLNKKHKKCTF